MFVAGSTLLAPALFDPVRRRVLHRVDRGFNRSGYHAELVMDGFRSRLGDEDDTGHILSGRSQVVAEIMQPSTSGAWVR